MKRSVSVLLLFIFFSLLKGVGENQISSYNYNASEAKTVINQTLNHINQVNDSAYLIFYPNLTSAYSYLNRSMHEYANSPDVAVTDASTARTLAQNEYNRISYYRLVSIPIMVAFTAVVAVLLYIFMKPVKVRVNR